MFLEHAHPVFLTQLNIIECLKVNLSIKNSVLDSDIKGQITFSRTSVNAQVSDFEMTVSIRL